MTVPHCLRKGFTLVEVLVVVAAISAVASIGYFTVGTIQTSVRENKLESDVIALNSAVQIYEAMGGDISDLSGVPGSSDENKVLTKLKIKADDETRSKFNGITGNLIDPRMTSGDRTTSGARAVWDPTKEIFEVVRTGGAGVKEFVLSDAAADEARALSANSAAYVRDGRVLDAANLKSGPVWVWDYTAATPNDPSDPANPGTGSSGDPVTPSPDTAVPTPDASAVPTATPGGGMADVSGALVGSATLNSTFVGDLVLAYPSNGVINNIAYNSGAVITGDLYVPGTPTIRRSNGTVWSPATDGLFANQIRGGSPRVIDLGGNPLPNNYSITFNNDSYVGGKIYRQIERYTLSPYDLSQFPPKPNNNNISYSAPPGGALSASPNSSITLNSTPVGSVVLNPTGTSLSYGTLIANNDTKFVLNGSSDPNNPTVYNIESLTLNSGADVVVNGYVKINLRNSLNVNTASVIGNVDHPEYLQLNVWGGDVQANSGSSIYGRINAPGNQVTFNAGSVMVGAVSARSLSINSAGIVFSLSPTTGN